MLIKQLIKAVIFGEPKSGKTAFFNCLRKKKFYPHYQSTAGVEFETIDFEDENISLKITDTTGNHAYCSIISTYLEHQDIFYLIIDPCADISTQLHSARQKIKASKNYNPKACYVAVLSKMDLINTEAAKRDLENNIKRSQQNDQEEIIFKIEKISAKNDTGITQLLNYSLNYALIERIAVHAKKSALELCCKYEKIVESRRFFPTDFTRYLTLTKLRENLQKAASTEQVKCYLIRAAREIRQPYNGKLKYGITLFCGLLHLGSYRNSRLYQLIEAELRKLDPTICLSNLSTPTFTGVAPLASMTKK